MAKYKLANSGGKEHIQEGSTDCGVFSVAAAYHCVMGDDFGGVTFEQSVPF